MNPHEGAKTRASVDSALSEELEAKEMVIAQICGASPLLAVVTDAVTQFDRLGTLSELLYADDSPDEWEKQGTQEYVPKMEGGF